jgi:hypothetical protein
MMNTGWKKFGEKILDAQKTKTSIFPSAGQGCQMLHFHNKNPNLGKFWRAVELKMLVVHLMVICNILQTSGVYYDQ